MPLYSYECKECKNQFDKILRLSEYKTPQSCPECSGKTTKLLIVGSIQDDSPAWLNQSIRDQLQDTGSSHVPIRTRTEYNRYLKDNGIVAD
jgi:putative FmdB family regulatory protein